jgi:predicted nucleic acid-binding protein
MIVVSDMTPLHYLILIGCDHILHSLYERVFTAPAVIKEMDDPSTPEVVRRWAAAPPEWLHVQEPAQIEDIPRLGHGKRGAGEKAAIALARELHAEIVLMDDRKAIQEAQKRGLHPVRMLTVLDAAAERGLVAELSAVLDHLEQQTPFYVSKECKRVIEDMKRRDLVRKQSQDQDRARQEQIAQGEPAPIPEPSQE